MFSKIICRSPMPFPEYDHVISRHCVPDPVASNRASFNPPDTPINSYYTWVLLIMKNNKESIVNSNSYAGVETEAYITSHSWPVVQWTFKLCQSASKAHSFGHYMAHPCFCKIPNKLLWWQRACLCVVGVGVWILLVVPQCQCHWNTTDVMMSGRTCRPETSSDLL